MTLLNRERFSLSVNQGIRPQVRPEELFLPPALCGRSKSIASFPVLVWPRRRQAPGDNQMLYVQLP